MTGEEIDAGADALRRLDQGGGILRPWDKLPNTAKRKWRNKAEAVLAAVERLSRSAPQSRAGSDDVEKWSRRPERDLWE
jgi:hypothetical protein